MANINFNGSNTAISNVSFNGNTAIDAINLNGTVVWRREYVIDNPNDYGTSYDDRFGYPRGTIAISDSYIAVSAAREDNSGNTNTGVVYIFDPANGSLLRTIDNPNAYSTSAYDYFGTAIALTDNYLAVSAPSEDDASGSTSGKVYLFNPANGSLLRTINNPNFSGTTAGDEFGNAIALTDNYLAVGAAEEDDGTITGTGVVYLFNPANGSLLRTIENPNDYDTAVLDRFGTAIALTDNYLVVGTPNEDDILASDAGRAYVFNPSTGALLDTLEGFGSDGDRFGQSVAVSDTYIAVGAYSQDESDGTNSGRVYLFTASNGLTSQIILNPNAYGTKQDDYFGYNVALTDNYLAVSAVVEDDAGGINSGKVYIFDPDDGSLLKTIDNPNAYGTSASDWFGDAIALTDTYIAVGAREGDADAQGGSSGKVYVFSPT